MKLAKILYGFSLFTVFNLLLFILNFSAQVRIVTPDRPAVEATEDYTWWYVMMFLLVAGLAGAIFWYLKDKKAKREQADLDKNKKKKLNKPDEDAVDFDSELEWYRKNKKIVNKRSAKNLPKAIKLNKGAKENAMASNAAGADVSEMLTKKIKNLEFSQLPLVRFENLEPSKPFIQLPISNDDALMCAIEQAQEEFEEDEDVRDLAVKILARFKNRNSVEALSQIALYDLSSSLRSKAIGILSDFDHESVFETLLLACADPTREVRAAAARGLFRLSFDRSDCWTRIVESKDEYRMRHAARAAIAGDLVERSFDRLVHDDRKVAYEVFTLIILLIKSGETKEVFNALENHRNPNVRKGILHIIKVTKEHNALDGLYNLLESENLSEDMREEIDRLVEEIGLVPA